MNLKTMFGRTLADTNYRTPTKKPYPSKAKRKARRIMARESRRRNRQ